MIVRNVIEQHPDATSTEIATILQQQGYHCFPSYIRKIRQRMRAEIVPEDLLVLIVTYAKGNDQHDKSWLNDPKLVEFVERGPGGRTNKGIRQSSLESAYWSAFQDFRRSKSPPIEIDPDYNLFEPEHDRRRRLAGGKLNNNGDEPLDLDDDEDDTSPDFDDD